MRVLITHTDLDGLGSAIFAIADKLVDRVYCWNNGYLDKLVLDDNVVIITDLSFDKSITDNAIVFDHHPASKGITNGVYDGNRCATKIFYEEYVDKHNKTRDKFAYLIDIYDRWQTKMSQFDETLDLNRVFEYMVKTRPNCLVYDSRFTMDYGIAHHTPYYTFIISMVEMLKGEVFKLTHTLQDYADQIHFEEDTFYEKMVDTHQIRRDSKGNLFAIVRTKKYMNENCNRFLEEYSDIRYILNLGFKGISARSIDDTFNLNDIRGLAGHPKAAGGAFDENFMKSLENGRIKELGYR